MTDDRERFGADLAALEHERKRYVEPIALGRVAIASLNRVRAALQSAEGVSVSDDLVDNFKATKTQIDEISSAGKFAELAISQLWNFHEHLSDTSLRVHVSHYIQEFSVAKDSVLGGFVSKKVEQVLAACGRTTAAVEATIAECERRISDVELNIRTQIERRRS